MALKDVSLEIGPGNFYVLMGENGAGKSTILRLIMGMERCDGGNGHLFSYALDERPPTTRHKIGLVAENIEFDAPCSIKKFIQMYAKFFPNWDQSFFDAIARDKKFDLNKRFGQLSRGQKMQLVLATELAKRPSLLLLDEVTSVLDIYSRRYYLELLKDFCRQGGSVLITTNIINEIQNYASHVLILSQGEIVLNSEVENIPTIFTRIVLNSQTTNHPIFLHENCCWARKASNGNDIYLVASDSKYLNDFPKEHILTDHPGLEEIFAFYFSSLRDISNQVDSANIA